MLIYEDDIDYEMIDWKEFEELCLDLLVSYNFHSFTWRQGAADKGRDIEAKFTVTVPLLGTYEESWFIECKKYSVKSGLDITHLSSKIEWAKAQNVDHFLLITTSYITTSCRDWLADMQRNGIIKYKVHLMEGKFLKAKLLAFPDLVNKYFLDNNSRLVKSFFKGWVTHGAMLDIPLLERLSSSLMPRRLAKDELVYMLYNYISKEDEIEEYCEYEGLELFGFDYLLEEIHLLADNTKPFLTINEMGNFNCQCDLETILQLTSSSTNGVAYYCQIMVPLSKKLLRLYLQNLNGRVYSKIAYD